jgi:GntR family transcriptional regulator of vanillate catabolism
MDPFEPENSVPGSLVAALRRLVADGRYSAGTRLAEEAVAADLGVSRTPVRLAFRTLAQEGLLQSAGKRGFVVREFSDEDVLCAVEVRGALEGLAARRLAERGLADTVCATLDACIADGEAMLAKGHLVDADIERWGALNARFHGTIVGAQGSRVIADAIARNNHLPFASADSITVQKTALAGEYQKLRFAQLQHRLVFDALARGEGARAEALMREHANIGVRYGRLFGLDDGVAAGKGPAARAEGAAGSGTGNAKAGARGRPTSTPPWPTLRSATCRR